MTYNTSLKCTSRIIRVYTETAHQAYGRNGLVDMDFDLIEGDSGHSVSIVNGCIQLGANKHYIIFGMIAPTDSTFHIAVATDESNTILNPSDGFFHIHKNARSSYYFPPRTNATFAGISTTYLDRAMSKNTLIKGIKSTGSTPFKFKLRGGATADENLSLDSQIIIIEMSE